MTRRPAPPGGFVVAGCLILLALPVLLWPAWVAWVLAVLAVPVWIGLNVYALDRFCDWTLTLQTRSLGTALWMALAWPWGLLLVAGIPAPVLLAAVLVGAPW